MLTIDKLFFVLTFLAALGCGLMAGFYFGFSALVMKGLANLPHNEGVVAMQSINNAVYNLWFMTAFLGAPAVCLIVMIFSLFRWHSPGSIYELVGSALFLIGNLLVTILFNIPRNDALAAVTPTDPGAAGLWTGFLSSWTMWNHVRAMASLVSAALLIIALIYRAAQR